MRFHVLIALLKPTVSLAHAAFIRFRDAEKHDRALSVAAERFFFFFGRGGTTSGAKRSVSSVPPLAVTLTSCEPSHEAVYAARGWTEALDAVNESITSPELSNLDSEALALLVSRTEYRYARAIEAGVPQFDGTMVRSRRVLQAARKAAADERRRSTKERCGAYSRIHHLEMNARI